MKDHKPMPKKEAGILSADEGLRADEHSGTTDPAFSEYIQCSGCSTVCPTVGGKTQTCHQCIELGEEKGSQDWVQTIKKGNGYRAIEPHSYVKLLQRIEGYIFFRTLQKHVKLEDSVLEAGCGWAFSSFALAAQHKRVTALDISGKLIADLVILKSKLGKPYDQFLSLLEGDIFNLDQIVPKQDVIFSDGTYEHFTKDERIIFLRKIRCALKENGTFIVQVPNMHNPFFGSIVGNKMPTLFPFTMERLSSELIAGGFQISERGYSFVNPGFEQWVQSKWMIAPIHVANFLFLFLPKWAKAIFCAHFYCVGVL